LWCNFYFSTNIYTDICLYSIGKIINTKTGSHNVNRFFILVSGGGLEPPTLRSSGECSTN
jgi:hypothetical protein